VVAAGLIEAGYKMVATGPGRTATDAQPTSELRLASGRKCRAFLVADPDPFDLAGAHNVADRVERVADETEHVLYADLLEHLDQATGYRL
jgi:hypothetical protein